MIHSQNFKTSKNEEFEQQPFICWASHAATPESWSNNTFQEITKAGIIQLEMYSPSENTLGTRVKPALYLVRTPHISPFGGT